MKLSLTAQKDYTLGANFAVNHASLVGHTKHPGKWGKGLGCPTGKNALNS